MTSPPPLKFVRLTKLSAADSPAYESGDWSSYAIGSANSGRSLPVAYYLEGWLVSDVTVGRPVEILRRARNGVKRLGVFISSDVTAILPDNRFSTLNSIYSMTVIPSPTE